MISEQPQLNQLYWKPVLAAAMNEMGKTLSESVFEYLMKHEKVRLCSEKNLYGHADEVTFLILSNMALKHCLSKELAHLQNLRELDLSGNSLCGQIPDLIGHCLVRLTVLNLNKNSFTGEIPVSLCELDGLISLNLR
jgi:Leucine-rich repeat (LRR) protein